MAKTENKVEVGETTSVHHNQWIKDHAQDGAVPVCLAFNKRLNSLRGSGLTEAQATVILMGELTYNLGKRPR